MSENLENTIMQSGSKIIDYTQGKWNVLCQCGKMLRIETHFIINNKHSGRCIKCGRINRSKILKERNEKTFIGVKIGENGFVIGRVKNSKVKILCMCGICKNEFISYKGKILGDSTNKPIDRCPKCNHAAQAEEIKKSRIGQKFGRLTIIGILSNNKFNQTMYFCKCDCMAICRVKFTSLSRGESKSCGCLANDISSEYMTNFNTVRVYKTGKDHSHWNHDITDEERQRNETRTSTKEYRIFRQKVIEKYNSTCIKCKYRANKYMIVHHLDSWNMFTDKRLDENNAIVLCPECHDIKYEGSFHSIYGNGNNTREQFEEFLGRKVEFQGDSL